MYAPLTAENRCDRCGAQARYVTAHKSSTLMWCGHHFRDFEEHLSPNLIFVQPEQQSSEHQPA